MGFRQADSEGHGGFARIWDYYDVTNGATIKKADGGENHLDPGNYSIVKLSTWKKRDEEYVTDFCDGYVKLIGSAHTKAKELGFENMSFPKGLVIQIKSCEVTTSYNVNTKKAYVNYAIFAFDLPDDNGGSSNRGKSTAKTSKSKTKKEAPVDDEQDDDLPF